MTHSPEKVSRVVMARAIPYIVMHRKLSMGKDSAGLPHLTVEGADMVDE